MVDAAVGGKTPEKVRTIVIDDRTQNLQTFDLLDLQQYTPEKIHPTNASKDLHLFYYGRDDVYAILKHVLSRVRVSLYLNMFGFDDDELNHILMKIALDPTITMLVTLDKSQAGGKHEAALLDANRKHNLALCSTHVVTKTHGQEFAIGQSATHQSNHTKGFVADGKVAGEGAPKWSASGEGQFVVPGKGGSVPEKGGAGYKAQSNTHSIITDPEMVSRFSAKLITEHFMTQKKRAKVGK
jgi:hypothetical protein